MLKLNNIKRIARIESIKTWNYPVFKALIILYSLLFLLITLIASNIQINLQGVTILKVFQFPHIWNTLTWFASWFNLILGILAIMMVSNEFQFRTFRKQIIDGLSRNELLFGKAMVMLLLAVFAVLLVFATGVTIGIMKTNNLSWSYLTNGIYFLPILFVQSLAYTSLALLFVTIIRTPGPSIMLYLLYFFPIEPIIRAVIPERAIGYLPAKLFSNLTPMPDFVGISLSDMVELKISGTDVFSPKIHTFQSLSVITIVALCYSLLFILISRHIIKRKNF